MKEHRWERLCSLFSLFCAVKSQIGWTFAMGNIISNILCHHVEEVKFNSSSEFCWFLYFTSISFVCSQCIEGLHIMAGDLVTHCRKFQALAFWQFMSETINHPFSLFSRLTWVSLILSACVCVCGVILIFPVASQDEEIAKSRWAIKA